MPASWASWSAWRWSRCRSTPGAVPPATPSAWRRGSPAAARCWCRGSSDPERLAVIASYCEPREMSRHIDMVDRRLRSARPACSIWPTSSARLSAATAAVYLESPSYLGVIEADGARDRRARPPPRRAPDRRRRPDLAGRAEGAGRLGCRHRRRPDPAAGRAHELRRRRRRLHGLARRGALRARVQRLPGLDHRHRQARPVRLRPRAPRTRPPTACASSARIGPATRSISGPSPTRSIWRCSGPQGMREVGEAILQRAAYAARRLAAIAGREGPVRRLLQGVRRRLHRAPARPWPRSTEALRAHGIFGGKDLSAEFPAGARAPSIA